ncbi:MAG: alanine racemase [Burkholderiales bacterium RIFCSPLOWO2_02_FULL_57_36]|nr:MAG: alanine racemase [Burkholderiales bacterium RIFCSPLOWO2_02_FULL_57_36]
MPRPLVATIDVAALRANLAVAKKCAPNSKVLAVVKANAYGHGLMHAIRGFAAADGLGLIEFDGAVQLRETGWQKPILLLEGVFEPADLATVIEYRLEVVVHCIEQVEMIEQAGIASAIDVHLKMNTGMNRLGFKPEAFRAAYVRMRALGFIRNITLMTHFANADNATHAALTLSEQVRRFNSATEGLPGLRSLSNSAADLLHPEVAADWVRPGIMLYGGSPGDKSAAEFGLLPAMTLASAIIGIQDVSAGDAVGYGSLFVADKAMKIGVVACGYADGYPRHAPTGTPIVVDGVRTRLVGRVSMDMIMVDLTPVPHARVGSAVTLWGADLPIDEVAHAAGTIGYELMCGLAQRVRITAQ